MWRMRGMARQSARSLLLSLPLPLRRCFSARGAPSTAAVLRAMAADAAELVAPLSRATAPAKKRTRLAPLADPEAEAARAAFLLREEAAAQQREANAAKAALIERMRWERHHGVSAEESERQTSRAHVPIAREDLMRPHAAVSSAARPARPHGDDHTEALAAAAVRSSLRPSFPGRPQSEPPRYHRAEQQYDDGDAHAEQHSHSYTQAPRQHQYEQHAAAAAARPPPRPQNSGASPFKQFDPFFDYAGALAESDAQAKAQVRLQQQKKAQALQQRRQQRAAEAEEAELSHQSLAERTAAAATAAASAAAATPAQPAQRSAAAAAAPRPSRPARPVSAPASAAAPAAPLTETPHMRTGPLPPKSPQARYADAMDHASRWDSSGKKVPFVPPSAVRPLRASKVFERDDAPANRAAAAADAAENGSAEPSDGAAAAAASASPKRVRGPGAPATAVTRNKFPLDKHQQAEALRAIKEAADAAAEEARLKKEEARAEAARKQRKQTAALMPDKDGKLPLQPADSPARPAPAVPAHPALYLRNFLAKIHPDLFHQSGAAGAGAGSSGPASSEHMVQVNQDTVAKFNAIVDYYKHVKALPSNTRRIPNAPVIPSHPDTLSFYCHVKDTPAAVPGAPAASDAAEDDNAPTSVKLFTATFAPGSFDLSSLQHLIGYIDTLFMRLLLASQAGGLHHSVRARWEVQMRARIMQQEMWAAGVEDTARAAGGYLTSDPTSTSLNQSPGRFKADYLSYYAQSQASHEEVRRSQGARLDAPALYAPMGPGSGPLTPLLESMLRSGLLRFDSGVDMLQRLDCLQRFMRLLEGGSSRSLYTHLWMGVRILVTTPSFEGDGGEAVNYRYSADEWHLPWNFEHAPAVRLIQQYLHAFHADNPQGLTLIEQVMEPTPSAVGGGKASKHKHKRR